MRISDWSSDVCSSDLDLGAFGREALDHPVLGIMPRIVDMLDRPGGGETVGGQQHAVAARQEQPAPPVGADGMAGIDMIGKIEIDRRRDRKSTRLNSSH